MKRCLALVPIVVVLSCRFGGPEGNPSAYVEGDAGDDGSAEDDATIKGDDSSLPGPPDAPATGDDTSLDSPDGAAPPDDAAGDGNTNGGSEDGSCASTFAVCDPVHNTGCNPFQQCDVDPTPMPTPTGLCLFNSGPDGGGGSCMMTLISETCSPGHTCVSRACRALCVCNSDCPANQCCSDTSGPPGFTLCGMCP